MRIVFILLLVCVVCALAKRSNVRKHKKRFPGLRRDASQPQSTGPCDTTTNTCLDPNDVCQTSDNNCYPKNTPGLDPKSTNPSVGNANGACTDKNVTGRASDCPNVKYLCNNQIYYTLMTEQCPVTCGRGCSG